MNRAFHFAIYSQTSPLVVQHIELLWSRLTPSTTVWRHPPDAHELEKDHDQILEAIVRKDAQAPVTSWHSTSSAPTRFGKASPNCARPDRTSAKTSGMPEVARRRISSTHS